MAMRSTYRPSSKKSPAANPDVRLFRLPGLPEIQPGDDLSAQITNAARKARMHFENGDILVVAQKIVSKADRAHAAPPTFGRSLHGSAAAERHTLQHRPGRGHPHAYLLRPGR